MMVSPLRDLSERAGIATALPRLVGDNGDPGLRAIARRSAFGPLDRAERPLVAAIDRRLRELREGDRMFVEESAIGAGRSGGSPELDEGPEHRRLAEAVSSASVSRRYGILLMRLARQTQTPTALEAGTGFGISGLYLSAGLRLAGASRLITLDASAPRLAIAVEGFEQLVGDALTVETRRGMLESELTSIAEELAPLGFAFLDAGHSEETTMDAFDRIAAAAAPGAVVVLDDVGWSQGMARAWQRLGSDPRVQRAVRFRRFGVCRLH